MRQGITLRTYQKKKIMFSENLCGNTNDYPIGSPKIPFKTKLRQIAIPFLLLEFPKCSLKLCMV